MKRRIMLLIAFLSAIPLIVAFQNFYAVQPSIPAGYACTSANSYQTNKPIFKCLNRSYTSAGSGTYAYDLYLPGNFSAHSINRYPVVVMIHGGAWGGDRASDTGISERLAGIGYVVANIEYYRVTVPGNVINTSQQWTMERNAPKDIAAFMESVIFNSVKSEELRLDLNKVSLAGFSAGGHLALMEATRGVRKYYGVFASSAPVWIESMRDHQDPNFKHVLTNVFGVGATSVRYEMSPYRRRADLKAKYLYMEHSEKDNLSPYHHAVSFYLENPVPEKSPYVVSGPTDDKLICRNIYETDPNIFANCGVSRQDSSYYYPSEPDTYYVASHNFSLPSGESATSGLEAKLAEIFNNRFKVEYEKDRIKLAQSNSAIWPVSATIDGNPYTSYTSNIGDRYNSQGYNLVGQLSEVWTSSSPTTVNGLTLRARMWGTTALGFPKTYNVLVTNTSNSAWVFVGNYSNQPDAKGYVEIKFPQVYQTHGVLIIPTELGADNYGNYYLQMADFDLRYRSDY